MKYFDYFMGNLIGMGLIIIGALLFLAGLFSGNWLLIIVGLILVFIGNYKKSETRFESATRVDIIK